MVEIVSASHQEAIMLQYNIQKPVCTLCANDCLYKYVYRFKNTCLNLVKYHTTDKTDKCSVIVDRIEYLDLKCLYIE